MVQGKKICTHAVRRPRVDNLVTHWKKPSAGEASVFCLELLNLPVFSTYRVQAYTSAQVTSCATSPTILNPEPLSGATTTCLWNRSVFSAGPLPHCLCLSRVTFSLQRRALRQPTPTKRDRQTYANSWWPARPLVSGGYESEHRRNATWAGTSGSRPS